jgi:UDP-glucuronate 4-epimerase
MAVLITGGAGFIGSSLAQRLLSKNEEVVILDNFNDYYAPATKRGNIQRLHPATRLHLIEGDIRNPADIERAFAAAPIQQVAHLAAMSGVRSSLNQSDVYVAVNTMGTLNLLEAARKNDVKVFAMASTSSVYGATDTLPFTETDSADRPLNAYAASKRGAELIGHTYHHLYGLNVTALRFFNVYGAAGRPDMMPMRLIRASQDGSQITLFNDGDIARDWTYIEDTVDGVMSALQTPLGYEVINLGLGSPISMREFVDIIQEVTGSRINTVSAVTPLTESPVTFCNNQKARTLLGFNPTTKVRDGLEATWEWYRKVISR